MEFFAETAFDFLMKNGGSILFKFFISAIGRQASIFAAVHVKATAFVFLNGAINSCLSVRFV